MTQYQVRKQKTIKRVAGSLRKHKGVANAVADMLDGCNRIGGQEDSPEGSRYIQISDTLARKMAVWLRRGFV